MDKELIQRISQVCQDLFGYTVEVELTRPEPQFGDYTSNVALQLAKKVGSPPREIAKK